MTPRLHEALVPFQMQYLTVIQAIKTRLLALDSFVAKEYERILKEEKTPESKEDVEFLSALRNNTAILKEHVEAQITELKTINKPRRVERYFNMVDGELVEVSKGEWKGVDDDSEAAEASEADTEEAI